MKELDRKEFQPGIHDGYGYISEKHILFPIKYQFQGGKISWRDVVLDQCPECGHEPKMSSERVKGKCELETECGFSAIEMLENMEIE